MRIYLVQHGLAQDEEQDPARALSNQGREDITRVAGFLSLFEKPRPSMIIHSTKLRAKQTAEMIAQAWQVTNIAESSELSPAADPEVWLKRLQELNEDILLVGHLPHLGKLASLLISGQSEVETVAFRNGGVICLEKAEAHSKVLWHINPTMFYVTDDK